MTYIPIVKSILLTGGIGDVIALESFFSDEQRQSLESIYYATRAHKTIRQIFEALPNYPSLKRHVIIWEDFSRVFAFHSKNELVEHINPQQGSTEQDWQARISRYQRWMSLLEPVADFSISMRFPQCNCYFRPYNGSSLLKHKIADIFRFCLPGSDEFLLKERHRIAHLMTLGNLPNPVEFIIVCPCTINDRRDSGRDFKDYDWEFLKAYLTKRRCFGVILNIGDDPVPEHPLLINLTNKTSFLESVEILKKASGYIGIDSSLSVLAAKVFSPPHLAIKSNNNHCYIWSAVYYAPQIEQPFLVKGFQG